MIWFAKNWRLLAVSGYAVALVLGGWIARGVYDRSLQASALKSQIEVQSKAQAKATATNAANSTAEVARLTAQAADYVLGRKLEDQAYADTSNGCGLSAGRIERLRQQ